MLALAALVTACGAPASTAEQTVCGPLRERLAFWSWSRAAGTPDPDRAARLAGAAPFEHRTRDGRTLRGWRLASRASDGLARRSVLVAGGNAMLADQILPDLAVLAEAGLEVVTLDYRGYGASDGKARLEAIVEDHVELARRLEQDGPAPLAFYGISLGGIVLTNVLGRGVRPQRMVIDGSPARISDHGCPERYDPVGNLPADTRGILFIGGGRDAVVPIELSTELMRRIEESGGTAIADADLAHPFMDQDPALHRARLARIAAFLAQPAS